jgi:Major capsid protein Gp23
MANKIKQLVEDWAPVLTKEGYAPLNVRKQRILAQLLENSKPYLVEAKKILSSENLLTEEAPTNVMGTSSSVSGTGPIDTFDPILISLIRRTMPNLIAYDLCGVQPMSGPTGLIFALRTRYANQTGTENFYNEVNTGFATFAGANSTANVGGVTYAGNNLAGGVGTFPGGANGNLGGVPVASNNAGTQAYNYAEAMSTAFGEDLGYGANTVIPEMGISIEKTTVTAGERALKAEYSIELAQDLKAIHGLDVESELTNLLSAELLAEINREIIRTIIVTASIGAQSGTTTPGIFNLDVDSDGRWLVEKFKGLMFRLDLEANSIAKNTRRGKGNVILCSSNVAAALNAAGVLQFTPRLDSNDLQVDDTGNTFAGVLNGRYKVYIDPYSTGDYAVMGFKGANAFDAGIFYCPYVPLQLLKAVDPQSLQPKIGFKTRYGVVANPFAGGINVNKGALLQDSNVFYNRLLIQNLM